MLPGSSGIWSATCAGREKEGLTASFFKEWPLAALTRVLLFSHKGHCSSSQRIRKRSELLLVDHIDDAFARPVEHQVIELATVIVVEGERLVGGIPEIIAPDR
jgi:hypothetical protein